MEKEIKEYENISDRNCALIDSLENEIQEAERKLVAILVSYRIKKGQSLRHLAKTLGISAPYLSDIESGRRGLSYETLQKIKKLKFYEI